MPKGLIGNTKRIRHSNAVAAGTSVITPSAGVDMAGFENCLFQALFGAITATAVTSIEIHQSDDDGVADGYSAILGTNVAITDAQDNGILEVEVIRPQKRYLKCIVNRATANAVLDGIIAIQTAPRSLPVTNDATIVGSEVHISAAEGTA